MTQPTYVELIEGEPILRDAEEWRTEVLAATVAAPQCAAGTQCAHQFAYRCDCEPNTVEAK